MRHDRRATEAAAAIGGAASCTLTQRRRCLGARDWAQLSTVFLCRVYTRRRSVSGLFLFVIGAGHGRRLAIVPRAVGGAGRRDAGGLRAPAGSGAVNGLYLLGGLMALALAGYLIYALLRAEEF
jgi:K+-transporting ATPase KdpF subunit